jgi:hypothetical protein
MKLHIKLRCYITPRGELRYFAKMPDGRTVGPPVMGRDGTSTGPRGATHTPGELWKYIPRRYLTDNPPQGTMSIISGAKYDKEI